jgi:hypothetical protein
MRKLSPERRRVAVICGACAAVIPSATLLMTGNHSNAMHFVGGLLIGLAVTLSVGSLVLSRRACS